MGVDSGRLVDVVVLQKGQVAGDLEKTCVRNVIRQIIKENENIAFHIGEFEKCCVLSIVKLVTNLMRGIFPNRKQRNSKLDIQLINHLRWSSQTCMGNNDIFTEKFTSILKHITDTHSWTCGTYIKNHCSHRELGEHERKKYFKKSTEEFKAVSKIVRDNIKQTKKYCHTGRLESFQSIALKYKPKRNHFSYDGIVARTILPIIDFNHNLGKPQTGRILKYSKSLKKWVGVNTYRSKRHDWRYEILSIVREVVRDKQSLKLDDDSYRAIDVPRCIATVSRPHSIGEIHPFL
ncbi:hypothetical protein PR048_021204 [Dryococelus australis]|uniref:Uncharacterized protein n=1 Tax=Dryococelus australis TaxID=614101 RepID=A0ABQ9GXM0_9NEOP|nr:hypothetical protein PR048_021204 [Dryococelus australis]